MNEWPYFNEDCLDMKRKRNIIASLIEAIKDDK